jgi:hypothetical protein
MQHCYTTRYTSKLSFGPLKKLIQKSKYQYVFLLDDGVLSIATTHQGKKYRISLYIKFYEFFPFSLTNENSMTVIKY